MNVVIRADASRRIGTGHVMRCLALADELRAWGVTVRFICRELDGHLCDLIGSDWNFEVHRLSPQPDDRPPDGFLAPHADWLETSWKRDAEQTRELLERLSLVPTWLIVDHYALDTRWEEAVGPLARRLMVIDDLADRAHVCDLLLDQNFAVERPRYDSLVPSACTTLLGPDYTLLRREFSTARATLRPRDGSVRRLLLYFGGGDYTSSIVEVLRALHHSALQLATIDVVLGAADPQNEDLKALAASFPKICLHGRVINMADLMASADLSIGAAGSTVWERCCLGLPSIVITVAENQERVAHAMAEEGYFLFLGSEADVGETTLPDALRLAANPYLLKSFTNRGMRLVDGKGAERVARALHELS